MSLMSKEEYVNWVNNTIGEDGGMHPQWSEPMYICPKCGGGMCKNLWTCQMLMCSPPITEYEYRCNNKECNNIEYLRG